LVLEGIPFREAYRKVAEKIEAGEFRPEKKVQHVHEGSIGNLCADKISAKKDRIAGDFQFEKIDRAFAKLLD
jgi:argininosuccinate lyase